jgi:xylan 1,4-beta-xylosidase
MCSIKVLLIGLAAVSVCIGAISGRVTDTSGIVGISGAVVMLEKGGQVTTSGTNGNFTIPIETNNKSSRNSLANLPDLSANAAGRLLKITIAEKSAVSITAYDLHGKAFFTTKQAMTAGTHSVSLPHMGTGVYLYKIKADNNELVLHSFSFGSASPVKSIATDFSVEKSGSAKQAKTTAAISDVISVNKTGYLNYRMAITNPDTSGVLIKLVRDTVSAKNPIIWADFPDPCVIRVGDTYYMSNTTMHMCPGVPISKSKDLVNWEPAGYAYQKMEDNDGTTLQNGKNMYGQGSWASSLRYHNGMFYVTFAALNTGKTYIYKTADVASPNWEKISFSPHLYDPSLFFDDDGRVYIVSEADNIRLTELNADLSGVKAGGVNQIVIPNASKLAGGPDYYVTAEGNHMYKVNGKYYHFVIVWVAGDMRVQLVYRADKITGPYEGRIFLHDQGVAEGGLVETADSSWSYALLFQDGGSVGRIPYLIPVKWQDGWPVADNGGKVPAKLNIPVVNSPVPASVASDEFDGGAQLKLQWQWNHNPDDRYWSLTQRPGFLRLTTGRVDNAFLQVRNMLTQRTFGPTSSGRVAVDVSNMKDGDVAGFALLQEKYGIVGVKMTGTSKSIVMISAESGSAVELASKPLAQNTVYFRTDCNFANKTDKAYFYYSLDGQTWTAIGKPLQMSYSLSQFVGYRFTLFDYSTKTAGGSVDFDYFRVSPGTGTIGQGF